MVREVVRARPDGLHLHGHTIRAVSSQSASDLPLLQIPQLERSAGGAGNDSLLI